ncbi:MAG: Imm44 family immunity protein [Chthoniobacteraceae bacterium]
MKLWIGGELSADIADVYRQARIIVENAINSTIQEVDYRLELDGWDCITIIRDDENFGEKLSYSKKKREMDFRLRVDHLRFRSADVLSRQAMLVQMLLRSIEILKQKGLSEEGLDRLLQDVRLVAQQNGWGNVPNG